jgi:hypothetical protein
MSMVVEMTAKMMENKITFFKKRYTSYLLVLDVLSKVEG